MANVVTFGTAIILDCIYDLDFLSFLNEMPDKDFKKTKIQTTSYFQNEYYYGPKVGVLLILFAMSMIRVCDQVLCGGEMGESETHKDIQIYRMARLFPLASTG